MWRPCFAQEDDYIIKQLDSISNPYIEKLDFIQFDSDKIVIRELSEDDSPKIYYFTFKNIGPKKIVITGIKTSCGCLNASIDKKVIKSGEYGIIKAVFNPKDQAGILYRNIFIYTNFSYTHPSYKLTLSGNIKPTKDIWDDYRVILSPFLRVRRDMVKINNDVGKNSTTVELIECVNTSDTDITLSINNNEYSDFINIVNDYLFIKAGEVKDIAILIDTSKIEDKYKTISEFPIYLKTNTGLITEKPIKVLIKSADKK